MHFLADLVVNALQRDVVFSVLLHFHELLQINSFFDEEQICWRRTG